MWGEESLLGNTINNVSQKCLRQKVGRTNQIHQIHHPPSSPTTTSQQQCRREEGQQKGHCPASLQQCHTQPTVIITGPLYNVNVIKMHLERENDTTVPILPFECRPTGHKCRVTLLPLSIDNVESYSHFIITEAGVINVVTQNGGWGKGRWAGEVCAAE